MALLSHLILKDMLIIEHRHFSYSLKWFRLAVSTSNSFELS